MIEPRSRKYKSFVVNLKDFEDLIREHMGNDAADYFADIAKELRERRDDYFANITEVKEGYIEHE